MIEPVGPSARTIAVFAKVPEAGAVKTRLIPALGAVGAAALHEHLIAATLAKANSLGDAAVCLWLAGDAARYAAPRGTALAQQQGADLGAKMAHAFAATLARSRACALIGSDCPALQPRHLRQAFDLLAGHDVVINPADDGGYVLIALKVPQPRLFEGIPWGGPKVLELTRARIAGLGLHAAFLPSLPDLDTPEDLERARAAGWLDF